MIKPWDIEAMATCPTCKHLCEMPEFINNFGICNRCWDELEKEHDTRPS